MAAKAAGTGRNKRAAAQKNSALKFIIPGIACSVILVAVILLIVAFQGERDPCTEYLEQMAKDDKDDTVLIPMSAIGIKSCLLTTCTEFDVSKCDVECPFGYGSNDEKGCPSSCECAMEGETEGDVAFNPAAVDRMLEEYGYVEKKEDFAVFFGWGWKIYDNIEVEGRFKVPYKVDEKFDPGFRDQIGAILKNMSRLACLDFIPQTDERDYLSFYPGGSGCSALIGRTTGLQLVNLPFGCRHRETVEHETLHALGFYHEHARPDRDGYVDLFLENANAFDKHNFKKKTWSQGKFLGTQYEITSSMQYESHAFRKMGVFESTIEGKGGVVLRAPKHGFTATPGDLKELNLLYGCEEMTEGGAVGAWSTWMMWSGCTATCDKGKKKRYRRCKHKETGEEMLANGCGGQSMEDADCMIRTCGAKGNEWSEWTKWSTECSATCGQGKRNRYRMCSSPTGCDGSAFEVKDCYDMTCENGNPVARQHFGQWSDWDNWRRCDVTCGEGERSRYRECMNGMEVLSEKRCTALPRDGTLVDGKQKQSYKCDAPACATQWVNPWAPKTTPYVYSTRSTPDPFATQAPTGPGYSQWGKWGEWTRCDVTCGWGKSQRKRECSGSFCPGKCTMESTCFLDKCQEQASGLFGTVTSKTANICIYGKLVVGKFDDDDAHDLICIFPDGCVRAYVSDVSTQTYIPDYITWEGKASVCSWVGKDIWDENLKIFAADVNGDKRDDLICMNSLTGEIEVTLNSKDGYSKKPEWRGKRNECSNDRSVAIHEMDGDGKADLLCGDSNNWYKYLYKNTGSIG